MIYTLKYCVMNLLNRPALKKQKQYYIHTEYRQSEYGVNLTGSSESLDITKHSLHPDITINEYCNIIALKLLLLLIPIVIPTCCVQVLSVIITVPVFIASPYS